MDHLGQLSLYSQPVPITSEPFIRRLAGVLVRRSGTSTSDAYEMARRAVGTGGTVCGCCGAKVKLYKRPINKGQIECLRDLLQRFEPGEPFHTREIKSRGGDYAKLAHFGLLWKCDQPSTWCVTSTGARFMRGEASAPRHAYMFFKELVGVSASQVSLSLSSAKAFTLESVNAEGVEQVYIK